MYTFRRRIYISEAKQQNCQGNNRKSLMKHRKDYQKIGKTHLYRKIL
jgi:hypothetical protein